MSFIRWMTAVALMVGAPLAPAAPWLGLVKSGTTSQTNDVIVVGTSTFNMDLRANTDGHAVLALQYSIGVSNGGAVTYGASPVTAANNPFAQVDLTNGNAQMPLPGSAVNHSNWTVWWANSGNDYGAFAEQTIGTIQFNVNLLGTGMYVFSLSNQELLNNNPGEDITDFATPGAFVLTVVPEPGAGALLACGGLLAMWRNRRRNAR